MTAEPTGRSERLEPTPEGAAADDSVLRCARRHLRIGWWSVLVFLSLGAGLEVMHAFHVDFYLAPAGETRRLLWTLAHVHGALLGLLHVAFAATVYLASGWSPKVRGFASYCLMLASLLLPAGFFLGGVSASGGDPALGVALVPAGALALLVGVLLTACSIASTH